MKPASFTYHRPGSVAEALKILARYGGGAKPLAGGQSLGPMLNMRLARPEHLVDLNDLIELDYVREVSGMIEVGALTRHHRLATGAEIKRSVPLLSQAAATIGHYAIRQRGTVAGSLVHADPAAQIPLLAVTLGAEVVVQSATGSRVVRADEFLQSIMTVDLKDTEMVTALRFPIQVPDEGWSFEIFSRRHGDFAMASVAATLRLDENGTLAALNLGLGGVGPVPLRMRDIEAGVLGATLDEASITRLARQAADAIEPEEDAQVPAIFRKELVETLTARALRHCLSTRGRVQ